jgi:hypothetical protein
MSKAFSSLVFDPRDPSEVIEIFRRATLAGTLAKCRSEKTSVEHIFGPGHLIASGDLHDHPHNFAALLSAANLAEDTFDVLADPHGPHLTLHELIHADPHADGTDPSYVMLARAALLKARAPERVHILLGNHELAQLSNNPVLKHGTNMTAAFNLALQRAFGSASDDVNQAIVDFLRSIPLGLRVTPEDRSGDFLCTHSIPSPQTLLPSKEDQSTVTSSFDTSVFSRALTDDDYSPRTGAAHQLTWGRDHTHESIEYYSDAFHARTLIVGHEFAPIGFRILRPSMVLLNSDHDDGCMLKLSLATSSDAPELAQAIFALREGEM